MARVIDSFGGNPGRLAVVSALMRNKTKLRRPDPSRHVYPGPLTKAQQELYGEKRKLAAEQRRAARNAKRVKP